ncbi:MAG TPA: serine/threonine-protein kinase [Planctomycetota bacterium]|nr:serine/threonine-protein kinase [Planctomycetota bacterium]
MSEDQVGEYKIIKVLGEGGMGTVFLGQHALLSQKVAIKALKPELFTDDVSRKRFLREAEALARLGHPNIIRLLNFHMAERNCFIVMEFAEGETLETKLKQGVIPAPIAIPWFLKILDALAYAHGQKILHRDLKPPNILITNEGTPKLLDFGTAKFTDGAAITQQGMTIGTLHYMSREQLLGKDLDPRTDLYSLAVALYETTTGYLPFLDEDPRKLAMKIIKEDPTPPRKHYPGLPRELERVILKGLSREAAQRFQTAQEFAKMLEEVQAGLAA